jgi:hypothetical protein
MRIGIDFDNTIVSYDHLFHKVALEKGLIPESSAQNKISVRNYLREQNKEFEWTLLQGEVYGPKITDAAPCKGVIEFIKTAQSKKHEIFIISHRTKFPFLGPKYDLHKAAQNWLDKFLVMHDIDLALKSNAFFELTKEDKISRISYLNCDVFIDDLPEILDMEGFLNKTNRILYDPENKYNPTRSQHVVMKSWNSIQNYCFDGYL